jgi:hypothetical protein
VARRHLLAAAVLAVLGGCDQVGEYGKEQFIKQADEALAKVEPDYQLTGAGIAIPEKPDGLPFGSAQSSVLPALEGLRGEAATIGRNEECPAGPLDFADYEQGGATETLYFQDGKFVGWRVRMDPKALLAMRRNMVAQEKDFEVLPDSTLGTEFSFDWNGPVHGLLEDESAMAAVSAMWAGTVCNFT